MNRRGEISALFSMSRSLSSASDIETILGTALGKSRALMNAEFSILKLLGSLRSRLVVAATSGIDRRLLGKFSKFEMALYKKALKTGEVVSESDIRRHFKKEMPPHLLQRSIRSVIMAPISSNKRKSGVLAAYISAARAIREEDIQVMGMVASLLSLAIDNISMLERVKSDYLHTIKMLAGIIDENDPYTRGHCEKVMKYSLEICDRLGLDNRAVNTVRTASLLHDVGKVGVDLGIIRKAGPLSDSDWRQMRNHPEVGARIVSQAGFLNEIAPVIRYHHAHFGGGGYPDTGRAGEKIPFGARIIAVADAFDAMTSDRPYRKAMSQEEAIHELERCSGSQFDPRVVEAFVGTDPANR